jgi:hypothetical protein
MTKSQNKNAWRSRRRAALREERSVNETPNALATVRVENMRCLQSRAIRVISKYVSWWMFCKATPFMNAHKRTRLRELLAHTPIRGKIESWVKANGYFYLSIEGVLEGKRVETSSVLYDLVDELSDRRFVLTSSQSFYELGTSGWNDEPLSSAKEKENELQLFHSCR